MELDPPRPSSGTPALGARDRLRQGGRRRATYGSALQGRGNGPIPGVSPGTSAARGGSLTANCNHPISDRFLTIWPALQSLV